MNRTRKWIMNSELDEMYKHPERFNPITTIRNLSDEVLRLRNRLTEEQEILKIQAARERNFTDFEKRIRSISEVSSLENIPAALERALDELASRLDRVSF